jgi:hypothetical protein
MNGVDTRFNTWDLTITPAARDFLSLTDPSMTVTNPTMATLPGALGPRQANGSLPQVDFLKLVAGSQMIDKGTNVGLPYNGVSPDLGAYEFGGVTAITPRAVSPVCNMVTASGNVLQDIQIFDVAGRRLNNSIGYHSFCPVVYKRLLPDGQTKAYTMIRLP